MEVRILPGAPMKEPVLVTGFFIGFHGVNIRTPRFGHQSHAQTLASSMATDVRLLPATS